MCRSFLRFVFVKSTVNLIGMANKLTIIQSDRIVESSAGAINKIIRIAATKQDSTFAEQEILTAWIGLEALVD